MAPIPLREFGYDRRGGLTERDDMRTAVLGTLGWQHNLFVVHFVPAQLCNLACPLAGEDQELENRSIIIIGASLPNCF